MRVFVSEYLTSGAWPVDVGEVPKLRVEEGRLKTCPTASLLREGRAMLIAIATDFARLPGCRVATTWDARLGPFGFAGIDAVVVSNPDEARVEFSRLVAGCEATFVIAPETDGLLAGRRRLVDRAGGRFPGCSQDAIELCADKLELARHLEQNGIATVETRLWEVDTGPRELRELRDGPVVVKPRDGAGSQATFLISTPADFDALPPEFAAAAAAGRTIVQPYVAGATLSVAAIVSRECERIDLFPVGRQRLSEDGRFRYLGGSIPAAVAIAGIERLVRETCRSIPGLAGYVGFDLILPDERPSEPLIVEINPRLTTSYLGYRALAEENLAERLLFPECRFPPVRWSSRAVDFLPDGTIG